MQITRNGKAVSRIVLGSRATWLETHAAEQLRDYVEKLSGARLLLTYEQDACPIEGGRIRIGRPSTQEGIRLRADHKKAGAVSVGMRTGNFENSSRQMQLDSATDVTEELFRASCSLLMRMWDGHKPLRLLNVTATRLTEEEYRQYDLFDRVDYGKLEKADRAMDSIRARFGEDAVMRASFLKSGVAPTGGGLNREKRRERMDSDRSVR